jgi:membrane protease YdiL (CAAX protease family)
MTGEDMKKSRSILRAIGWTAFRLVALGILLFAVYTACTLLWTTLVAQSGAMGIPVFVILQLIVAAIMVLTYRGGVRLIERRSASELGFASAKGALPGLLLGTALFCAVQAVLWMAGFATYQGFAGVDAVPMIFSVLLAAAIGEELIYRGVLYRVLEESLGTVPALIVSAGVFGFTHGANPGATVASSAAIALEAGLLLGLAYTATRSLWFPIGIHFAWNFAEGGIFNAPISGTQFRGMLNFKVVGPEAWTGGAFGPEASVVSVLVWLTATALLGWAAIRAGRWRAASFRRVPQPSVSAPAP